MAKAFGEVTPTQFQMLYLIVNNCNLKKSNSIEMYNGLMMDKMGLSVRMIQYNIKALEEKGFIKVDRPSGRNAAKKPNVITLCEVTEQETCKETTQLNVAINGAIDCTPYKLKEKEIKKELYVNTPVEVQSEEVTEIENTSKHNELKSEDMVTYTQEEVRELRRIYQSEWPDMEGTTQSERNTSKYNEISEWVGKKLSRGYDLLKSFRGTKTLRDAKGYEEELFNITEEMKKADRANAITENQSSAFEKFINAYNEAVANKIAYLNRGEQMKAKQSQTVKNEENPASDNLTNEVMEKAFNSEVSEEIRKAAVPAPATPSMGAVTDAEIKQMAKTANSHMDNGDFQSFTEVNERNEKRIKAYGTPEQYKEYKRLIA